jgi:nucleoside phosphorylase
MGHRLSASVASVLILLALQGPIPASSAPAAGCTTRLLVLSAFPAEMDKLITAATVESTVFVDGRGFYVGTLEGNDVVMALTGIGLVNARETTRTAFDRFRCGAGPGITGVVFSGVAGGRSFIGDVTIPSRWKEGEQGVSLRVDPVMLATVRDVARSGSVQLARTAPAGDPACAGHDPDLVPTVSVDHTPEVIIGGQGLSADPFGGRSFPCTPFGGDVFGCDPCRAPTRAPPDPRRFAEGLIPFLDPNFFLSYFQNPPPAETTYVAEDMETAAVARVAAQNRTPFIAFRAVSDGQGDPLMLPGFPFQFFAYRQLAADNAATVALAFLKAWSAR